MKKVGQCCKATTKQLLRPIGRLSVVFQAFYGGLFHNRFRDEMGIPTLKRLKPDAVPTIFARSVDNLQASSSQSPTTGRPLSQRRQQRAVRPVRV